MKAHFDFHERLNETQILRDLDKKTETLETCVILEEVPSFHDMLRHASRVT